jgi:hypothetical protein
MKPVRKKYDVDDFLEALKKKLRKEKDPVKKHMYQEMINGFGQ